MNYEQKYTEALEKIREGLQPLPDGTKISGVTRAFLEEVFPELKESEDERIRKALITFFQRFPYDSIEQAGTNAKEAIAWLKKQGEQNPIINVPTREVILAIWDLGNEWKELTSGDISTEYGTQLDYIQKHWHESEYYLREKQGEKKITTIDFNAKDWYVSKVDGKIHDMIEDKDAFTNPSAFENSLGHLLKLFEKLPKQDLLDGLKFYTNVVEHDGKYVKPTWSEEDETGWTNTMIMIKEVASNHYTKDSIKLVIDWLKSLKTRLS